MSGGWDGSELRLRIILKKGKHPGLVFKQYEAKMSFTFFSAEYFN